MTKMAQSFEVLNLQNGMDKKQFEKPGFLTWGPLAIVPVSSPELSLTTVRSEVRRLRSVDTGLETNVFSMLIEKEDCYRRNNALF